MQLAWGSLFVSVKMHLLQFARTFIFDLRLLLGEATCLLVLHLIVDEAYVLQFLVRYQKGICLDKTKVSSFINQKMGIVIQIVFRLAYDLLTNCYIEYMETLVSQISKFISASLQLYSPLPLEFTSDLHTLNAYLKTYSNKQYQLLEGFINRLTQKILVKGKSGTNGSKKNDVIPNSFNGPLKSHSSCTINIPELKFNLPRQSFQNPMAKQSKGHSNCRSGRYKLQDGTNPNRHKFGARGKRKHLKDNLGQIDKQNLSVLANYKINKHDESQLQREGKSIKIKSEPKFQVLHGSSIVNNLSIQDRKEQKVVYQRVGQQPNSNNKYEIPAQLKIKLKGRAVAQKPRPIENVNQIQIMLKGNEKELMDLLTSISFYSEQPIQVQRREEQALQ